MKSSEMKAQVRACVTSDLDETARLVWLFLVSLPAGSGLKSLCVRMSIEYNDARIAAKILEEAGLARARSGAGGSIIWEALPFRLVKKSKARETPGNSDKELSMSRAALRIFKIYQERRMAAGVGPWMLTAHSRIHLMTLTAKLDEHPSVKPEDFIRFAIKAYKDFAGFPTPGHLAGTWIWDEWLNASTKDRAAAKKTAEKAHAGKDYGDPSWARGILRTLGHREAGQLNDSGVTYIYNRAREVVDFDSVLPDTEEWSVEIMALVEVLRQKVEEDAGAA